MYITYSAYRSKNNEFIDRRTISLPIGDFRQLLNLDGIIVSVIEQDLINIPNINKFGRAYIGELKCERFEIVDEDNTDAMNEEQFREYFKEISNVPLIWSKTNQSQEEKVELEIPDKYKKSEKVKEDDGNHLF